MKPNLRCKRGMTVHTFGLVLKGNPNVMLFHSSTLLLTLRCWLLQQDILTFPANEFLLLDIGNFQYTLHN